MSWRSRLNLEAQDLRRVAGTPRPGDLWLLGPHRLICGDAREPRFYETLIAVPPVRAGQAHDDRIDEADR